MGGGSHHLLHPSACSEPRLEVAGWNPASGGPRRAAAPQLLPSQDRVGTISARPSGRFPRTAPRARGTFSSLLLLHHYRHCCWTKAALRVACRSLSPTTLLSPRHLGFCPCVLSPSLPPLPFMLLPPTARSSPLSPSSLFYLNLPQICSPTKQLPSLFWAIICGSAARAGPPGRQSPGNRVSASYCGVCPSRSITRSLTSRGRRPESPLGYSRNVRPGPPRAGPGPGKGKR